jgi:urate oxidase
LSVDVELDGDFDSSYTKGDNSRVIPTDTMKNTVYAFARELDVRQLETFAWTLGSHFVENFDHVDQAMVKVTETPWQRIESGGKGHPHAFLGTSTERNTCVALVNRAGEGEPEGTIECGLEGLVLLKTTESGFSNFLRDEFTTLKETDDRIFATAVTAAWSYNDTPDDWRGIRRRVRGKLIHEFAARFSPSVQATLFEMCSAVLDAEPAVEEISLSMPNLHRLLIDLTPFELTTGMCCSCRRMTAWEHQRDVSGARTSTCMRVESEIDAMNADWTDFRGVSLSMQCFDVIDI